MGMVGELRVSSMILFLGAVLNEPSRMGLSGFESGLFVCVGVRDRTLKGLLVLGHTFCTFLRHFHCRLKAYKSIVIFVDDLSRRRSVFGVERCVVE